MSFQERARPRQGHGASGSKSKQMVVASANRAGLDQSGEKLPKASSIEGAEIEVYRDAGIEIDRVERRADRGAVAGRA